MSSGRSVGEAACVATATFVRELADWGAPASLYRLSEPLSGFEYVVVAACCWGEGADISKRPKLRVFGCEHSGEINSYRELAEPTWVRRGHTRALARCGYRLREGPYTGQGNHFATTYAVGRSIADACAAVSRSEAMSASAHRLVFHQAVVICADAGLTAAQTAKALGRSRWAVWMVWGQAKFSVETGVSFVDYPTGSGPDMMDEIGSAWHAQRP